MAGWLRGGSALTLAAVAIAGCGAAAAGSVVLVPLGPGLTVAVPGPGTRGISTSPGRPAGPRRSTRPSASATANPATGPNVSATPSPSPSAASVVPVGADVSWPQCPAGVGDPPGYGLPMPADDAEFVVIGLTNGRGFTENPCLAAQVSWARHRAIWAGYYVMLTYPTPAQLTQYQTAGPWTGRTAADRLANTGYAQARAAVGSLDRVLAAAPFVWVDVEDNTLAPWSPNIAGNRAVLTGAIRGFEDAGLGVGVYGASVQFRDILGSLTLGLPEWRTAGPRGQAAALARCTGPDLQGGRGVLAQWWLPSSDRDLDLVCPAFRARTSLRHYFRRYYGHLRPPTHEEATASRR